MRDTTAGKNLLFRRLRCLANYEAANRALEKARAKNKDVHAVSFPEDSLYDHTLEDTTYLHIKFAYREFHSQ